MNEDAEYEKIDIGTEQLHPAVRNGIEDGRAVHPYESLGGCKHSLKAFGMDELYAIADYSKFSPWNSPKPLYAGSGLDHVANLHPPEWGRGQAQAFVEHSCTKPPHPTSGNQGCS